MHSPCHIRHKVRGKCYTHITAHISDIDIAVDFTLNTKTKPAHYVPVVSFRFNCESLYESEFLQHYPTPDLLNTTADKLRWYRLTNGYLQKEIADMTGIHRSTYVHYENNEQKLYNIDYLQKIADIYNVNIACLLDDYMMFMYKGQRKQIKALRKSLGLTQKQLAEIFKTPKSNIKHWEQESSFMQYNNFVKIKRFFDI